MAKQRHKRMRLVKQLKDLMVYREPERPRLPVGIKPLDAVQLLKLEAVLIEVKVALRVVVMLQGYSRHYEAVKGALELLEKADRATSWVKERLKAVEGSRTT